MNDSNNAINNYIVISGDLYCQISIFFYYCHKISGQLSNVLVNTFLLPVDFIYYDVRLSRHNLHTYVCMHVHTCFLVFRGTGWQ